MANPSYNYFIKGDISGIQDFIFNVKSEKAARVLKARSVFVEALSVFAEQLIINKLTIQDYGIFYNGGGSFYLSINEQDRTLSELEDNLKDVEIGLNAVLFKEDIYIAFSIVPIENEEAFPNYWKAVSQQSNVDKLRKYLLDTEAFEPYLYLDVEGEGNDKAEEEKGRFLLSELDLERKTAKEVAAFVFEELSKRMETPDLNAKKELAVEKVKSNFPIWRGGLYDIYREKIQTELEKRNSRRRSDERRERITKGRSIIDYHFLAEFAYERTGTKRIGILKMDIDDLGNLFSEAPDKSVAQEVSKKITTFLGETTNQLLETPFLETTDESKPYRFQDNIYTIFSGGDDCFFVGAWDAIFEWAKRLHSEFTNVAAEIKTIFDETGVNINAEKLVLPPTISAGIVLVEPTYPVVRFYKLANAALDRAKYEYVDQYDFKKNKIALFDEVLSWEEFEHAKNTAELLAELVNDKKNPEPKSTLEKIRQSARKFQQMQRDALEKNYINMAVGKLFYMLRNSRNEDEISKQIILPYAKDLIGALVGNKHTNPMQYPLAARWAELLTRNSK